MNRPRFGPKRKRLPRSERVDGLVRLMKSIHRKSKNAEEFIRELRARYPFLPPEVVSRIWREEIGPMDRIRGQFRKKGGYVFDKASWAGISRMRGFMLRERLRNTAIAILEHEIRKTN